MNQPTEGDILEDSGQDQHLGDVLLKTSHFSICFVLAKL